MDDETLNFEEHRRRREQNASLVRCARCGKNILATATRCPECGVNFQGEAQDYLQLSEQVSSSRASHWLATTIIVVVLLILLLSVLRGW